MRLAQLFLSDAVTFFSKSLGTIVPKSRWDNFYQVKLALLFSSDIGMIETGMLVSK